MRLRAYVALPVSGWRRRWARRRFRYLLERHRPGQVLFETVREYLSDQGLMLKQGSILDARIIAALASRKNRRGERDPETKQSRKGKQWHLGMKLPIGVDDQTGLVHSLATPFAKVHDRTPQTNCFTEKRFVSGGMQVIGGLRSVKTMRTARWHGIAMRSGQRRR